MQRPILIVEDEENDLFFLKRALERADIKGPVYAAINGQQAMDYLAGVGQFADRSTFPFPAFIFLDLKLPLVHGLEVLKWVREQPSISPVVVIALSSSSLNSDVECAYRAGANSYVVKPSDPERLVEMAQSFARWWLQFSEPLPRYRH